MSGPHITRGSGPIGPGEVPETHAPIISSEGVKSTLYTDTFSSITGKKPEELARADAPRLASPVQTHPVSEEGVLTEMKSASNLLLVMYTLHNDNLQTIREWDKKFPNEKPLAPILEEMTRVAFSPFGDIETLTKEKGVKPLALNEMLQSSGFTEVLAMLAEMGQLFIKLSKQNTEIWSEQRKSGFERIELLRQAYKKEGELKAEEFGKIGTLQLISAVMSLTFIIATAVYAHLATTGAKGPEAQKAAEAKIHSTYQMVQMLDNTTGKFFQYGQTVVQQGYAVDLSMQQANQATWNQYVPMAIKSADEARQTAMENHRDFMKLFEEGLKLVEARARASAPRS